MTTAFKIGMGEIKEISAAARLPRCYISWEGKTQQDTCRLLWALRCPVDSQGLQDTCREMVKLGTNPIEGVCASQALHPQDSHEESTDVTHVSRTSMMTMFEDGQTDDHD